MEQKENKARRHFSPEEKFRIVKEALMTKTSMNEICRKYGISPGNFYSWQEKFFNGALSGCDCKCGPKTMLTVEKKTLELEEEVHRMREVIAEITAENIAFKKKNSSSLILR